MRPDLNIVKELHPGVFGAIMWLPTSRLLAGLLDPAYPHVLVCNHYIGRGGWEPFRVPIVTPTECEAVLSRPAPMDFVMVTDRFRELLPRMPEAIRAVQLRRVPPDYFDLNRIHGPERFRLLGECGWHGIAGDAGQRLRPCLQSGPRGRREGGTTAPGGGVGGGLTRRCTGSRPRSV